MKSLYEIELKSKSNQVDRWRKLPLFTFQIRTYHYLSHSNHILKLRDLLWTLHDLLLGLRLLSLKLNELLLHVIVIFSLQHDLAM